MPEAVWLTPFIHVPAPDDGAELRYCQEAVDQVLRFFGLLVFGQNEWAGQPFELLPWQEQIVREFYGVQVRDDDGSWVRYRRFLYDEIPKKNGKSEFAAGLGLYHLLADGEALPNVGIFAVDKENADIIYKCASLGHRRGGMAGLQGAAPIRYIKAGGGLEPMNLWRRRSPEERAERRRRALSFLGLYLDDLLMVSGGVCFVSAAALRWGAAAGLATAGGCLVLFSVLVARAGRR